MRHFVDQNPVVSKNAPIGHATDVDANRRARETVSGAGANPVAIIGDHQQPDVADGESPEIRCHCPCAAADPIQYPRAIKPRSTVGENNLNVAAAN
jgi:hypothetical protein